MLILENQGVHEGQNCRNEPMIFIHWGKQCLFTPELHMTEANTDRQYGNKT